MQHTLILIEELRPIGLHPREHLGPFMGYGGRLVLAIRTCLV